jgi:nitroreductase
MTLTELIETRRSVRAYRRDLVDDKTLHQVLEAARLAPTAANRQPVCFIVVHTAGREQDLLQIYNLEWFVRAPLVICACSVPARAWVRKDGKNYSDIDVAISMDHLILAATELGLGTCWVAAFDAAAARRVLSLPEGVDPIAFTPLGYSEDTARPRLRKPLSEIVKYEHW